MFSSCRFRIVFAALEDSAKEDRRSLRATAAVLFQSCRPGSTDWTQLAPRAVYEEARGSVQGAVTNQERFPSDGFSYKTSNYSNSPNYSSGTVPPFRSGYRALTTGERAKP